MPSTLDAVRTTLLMLIVCIGGYQFTADAQTVVPALDYRVLFERNIDYGAKLGELVLDSQSRRLYGVGSKVVDIDNVAIVDSMPDAMGHGFAFAPELNRGISRRGVVFDIKSHAVLRSGAGHSARTVAYDAKTKLAALNYDTLLIVDVAHATVRSAIPLGNSSYVTADGRGQFYVPLESDTLVVIDAKRATVRQRWALGSCRTPTSMAMDRSTQRLFVSCKNQRLVVMDYSDGRIVADLVCPVGNQMAFDPARRLLFIPTAGNTLTVIKEENRETFRVVGGIPVGTIHTAVAVDPRSGTVFLVHFGRQQGDLATVVLLALAPSDTTEGVRGANGRQ